MLEAGDGVVEAGLGFPNLMPTVQDAGGFFHSGFDLFDNDTRSIGQLIFKGEYMMADNFGVIAAVNYGYFAIHSESEWLEYNPETASYITHQYYYKTNVHKFRLTAGFNIHLVRTKTVDSYVGFMAGTKKALTSYETNDPSVNEQPQAFVIPFALRVHYGVRLFFTENIGANLELGLGGPTISLGATYKF